MFFFKIETVQYLQFSSPKNVIVCLDKRLKILEAQREFEEDPANANLSNKQAPSRKRASESEPTVAKRKKKNSLEKKLFRKRYIYL